jgi:ParB family chromosome partitioning protein
VKQLLNDKPHKDKVVTKEDKLIYQDLEDRIRKIMGTKVSIHKKNNNKGSIEIEYYSNDEFDRIIELFQSLA